MAAIRESQVNIYIVDDDEMQLKILKNKFSSCSGYKIYTYLNGKDFLADFTKLPYFKRQIYIVIFDYLLNSGVERENGIEIMKRLKQTNNNADYIILSGVDDADIASLAIKSGAVAYIKKNENSYLRIQNQVKYIISQRTLDRSRKHNRFARSFFIIAIFALIAFGLLVIFSDIL
ncbi:MAG: hypothetical protein CVU05_10695 [Bacteroidetes bacterium HGW-Bacteroidetes-21]|jgi:FixJ family two-component response regulator|nr:MAG: hypothetical protein CVU05_10695 [Bacteroidetes bacterium HGW-Bacteroidetes-21]